MLQNWTKPLSQVFENDIRLMLNHTVGKNIVTYFKGFPELKKIKVAIIGMDEQNADVMRVYLYRLSNVFPKNTIADLGNLRKKDPSFIIPLIHELIASNIMPILIGGHDELATAQFLAYQEAKAMVNFTVIDECLRFLETTENQPVAPYRSIFEPRHPLLFHFSLIGAQAHQLSPEVNKLIEKQNFDLMRLGKAKVEIDETEPVLRDADLLAFHLAALKQSEAPGVANPSPSGFFCEDACQLSRYAGMSDKLTSFGIYGYQKDLDINGQTAHVAAQMIWYFLDGFFSRKHDFPISTDGMNEYIVELPGLHYQLTFWKSVKSGRWWIQVPVETKRKHKRHRLVPCSFQDYQMACREELPERLIQAFRRFD